MAVQQSPLRYGGRPSLDQRGDSGSLADLLERILDKGIVIAGDISISLVDVELLTIKLRLLITSVDKAREIGVNWWESDPWLQGRQDQQAGVGGAAGSTAELESRLARIEQSLAELAQQSGVEGA